ncbi:hypothetical protein PVK06_048620 [Gossypium arboreum]|uniref:DUF4283 domain-containing protein n=1 Tax=Gossypium arboreum TaxID=29729 RepID=A0ABR0MGY5_GOSAR|nr:hypothetical protein PVK06_048620 [Gossypium arboreum]
MDLENDYYLVHFNDEEYYNKVLTNGSWVIFGQVPDGEALDIGFFNGIGG